ncbi:MAG: hypothetical protein COV46_08600 [Deltaproteobacteria bacterium CG11_big_fil_rev_8_21_14_0_20_49_13]|nr:MAG: hypothetical protein COV46_08600 [Deltaproteobacteria bacterium CG11_big_fil_rev_8_21_14_0_20_49_13]
MPQYFPASDSKEGMTVQEEGPSENVATGSCTVKFTAHLCVSIYGEFVKVGVDGEEPLCADIDPIPLEIMGGTNIVVRGNTFPDVPFEGHGLPAPITLNGKGNTDGVNNVGNGSIDESGNIEIEGYSFFINALGMVGEVPDLAFTTGSTEDLEGLGVIEGSPLTDDGKLTLVIGTKIGHLFPAADEKLYGASLSAIFEGEVSPSLSQCKGGDSKPQSTFVTKIVLDDTGHQTEAMLPGLNSMEIGKAYISQGSQDIGPDFESSAKFRIVNATAKPISIDIPQIQGPFMFEALQGASLKQELPSKRPLILKVTFHPEKNNVEGPGEISRMLMLGPDVYQLVGEAMSPSGKMLMDVEDADGRFQQASDTLKLGEVAISTTGRREFFSCRIIKCDGAEKLSQCIPCVDVLLNICQLLSVDKNGAPIGTVDPSCDPVGNAKDLFSIGLGGQGGVTPSKRTIEIKNEGVKPLTISAVDIEELPGSKSVEQFQAVANTALPVTLKPYNISKETFRVTAVYEPSDLIGFDGSEAVVGRPAKDRAMLRVSSEGTNRTVELLGMTSVKEVPSLHVYFKSATGTKEQTDGSEFAFRGLTTETNDLAAPVFIKLSDSAVKSVRVTKISLDAGSAFEWLDTKDKIDAKPENVRCTTPIFDAGGGVSGRITDLKPVGLLPNGFDVKPGAYTADSMPLFGCVNFHAGMEKKKQYKGGLTIQTVELESSGQPVRNPDGSLKQTMFNIGLLAVINPIKGKLIFRLTQTMAGIMNPQFPGVSAASSKEEMDVQIADGLAEESDKFVMPGAIVLDPFDEETIKDEKGNVVTTPGDGITMVYRKIDTHPVKNVYDDPLLPVYTSLVYDGEAPEGNKGVFFDYPNVPETLKNPGLRIYTASLSYPGPLATPDERAENISLCQQVDPCGEEEQKLYGKGPTDKTKRGVCSFFYCSAGGWDKSPSMHLSEEFEGGERKDMCKTVGEPQKLSDIPGYYQLNGRIDITNVGFRLWGPTYFNNPAGPLGPVPPMDAIFNLSFTTGVLLPGGEHDLIPDKRVNIAKQEYKINLTDTTLETPRLCDTSVKNRPIRGEVYSSWKYLAPLLVKDEEGAMPAGCPEPGNNFTGGSAFLRGRPLDQETGSITLVATAKFASDNNLTFAFKDVMFFVVLNGWMCDPEGSEDNFEGVRCYDNVQNSRDANNTISMME